MEIKNKIILVTGGGNGIGKALCDRFAAGGAQTILVADIDFESAGKVADAIGGKAYALDVSSESECRSVVTAILEEFGKIDIVCSNAGIGGAEGSLEVANDVWQKVLDVNLLSHVYLARAVFPSMVENGGGGFMITASAAGLLTHPTAAPYAVSKHAAVALAESLSIEYHSCGIYVSCLCPQGVRTRLIMGEDNPSAFLQADAISPEQCAEDVIDAFERESFLILPHVEVGEFILNKAENYDRWLHSLRKIRDQITGSGNLP
ncbi:MAG: SDR family oxidoreductase [Pyrinomonadaceae bacterium]